MQKIKASIDVIGNISVAAIRHNIARDENAPGQPILDDIDISFCSRIILSVFDVEI